MAEAEATGQAAGKGADFLKQKIGPLPLFVWIAIGLGLYLYFQKRGSGSGTAAPGTNQATDPAGNIGTIDPATGYVDGTPEDLASIAADNGGGSGSSGTSSTSGATVAGQFSDNNAWASAAINYLVGLGIDPTQANEAVQDFLASQPLSVTQQADVNEAIQSLGAPPTPPGPSGTTSAPVVTPPGGGTTATVNATNPPTGFKVQTKTSKTVSLVWSKTANATGYTVTYGPSSKGGATNHTSAPASQGGLTIGDLTPNTAYTFSVQATPAAAGAGSAKTTATTPKS
jgi:Fibronectin type III domain